MYLKHFKLNELPFTLTPNTSFYCDLPSHQEAFQVLVTAIENGEGVIKVTGEVGTGKTLLCRKLLNEMPDNTVTVYLPNPYLSPTELRLAIAAELGIDTDSKVDEHQLAGKIEKQLLQINQQGKAVVVLLDEAQAFPDESLEALRLISNLETESRKLVQLVLFGQPELDERIGSNKFRQLRQRITFSYKLRPLGDSEIGQYVFHRLQVAGYHGPDIFSDEQLWLISRASRGVPRLTNVLCHKSLMMAYAAGRFQVSDKDVKAAIKDTEDTHLPSSGVLAWFSGSFLVAIALGTAFAWWMEWISF